jgi:hypothetical protein
MTTALTLAEFIGSWTYYIIMGALLVGVLVLFKVLKSRSS